MKAETDETLRLRRAWRSLSLGAVPQPECPDPERLWEAARGEAGPGEVREMIEHTATCGACAEDWRLARELRPEAVAEGAELGPAAVRRRAVRGPARRWRRAAVWVPAAAAAAILALVGLEWRDPTEPRDVVLRGGDEDAVIRPLVAEGAVLPRDDFVLRWEGPEDARYDLTVSTEDFMTVLAQAWDLEVPEYRVAEEDLAAVAAGSPLYWRVEARGSDGGTETETFKVLVE